MLIAGIDPGVTTGCVLVVIHDNGELRVVECKQLVTINVLMAWLSGLPTLSACIVEDYIGSGHRHKSAVHTIQVIGAIRGWAAMRGQHLTTHPPQWRRPFVKEARVTLGVKHSGRHAADALAHILSYLWHKDHHEPC